MRGWYSSSLITGLSVITRGFTCNPGLLLALVNHHAKVCEVSRRRGVKPLVLQGFQQGFCETVCCCRPRAFTEGWLSVCSRCLSCTFTRSDVRRQHIAQQSNCLWPQHCGTIQKFQKYIEIKSNTISCDISTIIWKHWDCAVVRSCCWGQRVCVQQEVWAVTLCPH